MFDTTWPGRHENPVKSKTPPPCEERLILFWNCNPAGVPPAADLEYLRGVEGDAARHSFSAWSHMVLADREVFGVSVRL